MKSRRNLMASIQICDARLTLLSIVYFKVMETLKYPAISDV